MGAAAAGKIPDSCCIVLQPVCLHYSSVWPSDESVSGVEQQHQLAGARLLGARGF